MGKEEREVIKEYLIEGLARTGNFSSIKANDAWGYAIPEEKRCISLERGEEKYLIVVHSDPHYKGGQAQLLQCMRFLSQRNIACISVFDDSVFYNWDEGPFKPSRTGTPEEIRKRIKLLGLERQAQELGPLTYYKQKNPRLEIVRFTGGVIADYRNSPRTPEWIKERKLLTVMDPEVLETLTKFDLDYEKEAQDVRLARFICPRAFIEEDYDPEEGIKQDLDRRLQFAIDQAQGGDEEAFDLLTEDDLHRLRLREMA